MTQLFRATITATMIALALPCAARAQANPRPDSGVDKGASSVGFTVSAKMLFTFKRDGRFRDFTGSVAYDPGNPANTRVDLTVYTGSVDMADADQNELLRSKDFFDVDQFPTMHFVSTAVNPGANGQLAVTGDLTVRGVTKRIVIPVKVTSAGGQTSAVTRFETQFQIDRTEFGIMGRPDMGGVRLSISKNVQIRLAIAAPNQTLATH